MHPARLALRRAFARWRAASSLHCVGVGIATAVKHTNRVRGRVVRDAFDLWRRTFARLFVCFCVEFCFFRLP
jgi:hypothetical protein